MNDFMVTNMIQAFFEWIVRHRVLVLALALLTTLAGGVGATRLAKDTSADAFIDPANPALLHRKRVEASFGITDPIVIGLFTTGADGIYTPALLERVRQLTAAVSQLPQVDPQKTRSVATEAWIRGTADGMEVQPLLAEGPVTAASATQLRQAIADSPLYRGTLVSEDGRATLIVAELMGEKRASAAYAALTELVAREPLPPGVEVHVAGEGAVTGHLSAFIDADARRMIPVAVLIIFAVLFAAFRTLRAALVPMLVVLCTIAGTLGLMAAAGVSYFVITSGMVVALIGIAVADSLHVFNGYYERAQKAPAQPAGDVVVATMTDMFVPVTLTTLTTIAGFLALWVTNDMPPIRWFGVFGAVGVFLAWCYTITLLPAVLAMLPLRPSPVLGTTRPGASVDDTGIGWLMRAGAGVVRRPGATLAAAALVCAVGVVGMLRLHVDYSRIDNFGAEAPLHRADVAINARFDGSHHLDVVVIGSGDDALYDPEVLHRIEQLQQRMATVPGVGGSQSIVDYVRQMNRAVNGGAATADRLPDSPEAVAQLFLLYSLSSDPTDFEDTIDAARREALVRFHLATPRWSDHARIVRVLEGHVAELFPVAGARAAVTGRVMVDHVWMQGIRDSHFASVVLSLLVVFLMCALLFRSLAAGVACLVPVVVAVLGVYAVMGFGNVWLGVATSMFASVAIGLGIDFAIHAMDRARQRPHASAQERVLYVYRSTGRPMLFNALAVVLGFGVLLLSEVPPVEYFGLLVTVGVAAAFIASLTVLTAGMAIAWRRRDDSAAAPVQASVVHALRAPAWCAAALLAGAAGLLIGVPAGATARAESATALMQRVHARPDGQTRAQTVRVDLTNRQGVTRVEETRMQRLRDRDGTRRTFVAYLAPVTVRGTSFLTYEYAGADRDDDQWLYLPALRKVRRIPAADRGDNFLGTDLSYEDIKNDGRPDPADWTFTARGGERVGGVDCRLVEGVPSSSRVAAELGVSRARWCIEEETLIARRTEFWDRNGNPSKLLSATEVRRVGDVWIAVRVVAENLKSGHRTVLSLRDIAVDAPVDANLFTPQRLARGQ